MKRLLTTLAAGLAVLSFTAKANAAVLNFDTITTADVGLSIPSGYGGLNWSNIGVTKDSTWNGTSGYTYGTISPHYVAFNNNGNDSFITSNSGSTFTMNNAYFTSAWDSDNYLTVTGYNGITKVGTTTVLLNKFKPKLIELNFENINKLVLHSSHNQFAMDNMRINELTGNGGVPTPEPSMMILGLVSLAGSALARRK